MKYQPPYAPNWPNVADPNAPYINGNPPQGIKGSVPPASAFEYPMREIVGLISKGGIVPSDADLLQLTKGARRALYQWAIDTGSANSLSVALDPPLDAYGQGLEIRVLVSADNTGASTIRVNGLATQQIVKKDGSQLYAGDLRGGGVAVLVHDGANFQLVSGAAGSTTIQDGWFNGADYMVDVGTVNHIVGTPLIAPTAYAAGQGFCVLVKNRNTGPVDINVNALGVRPLKLPTNQDLEAGDIVPLQLIYIRYDGSTFTMLSPIDMAVISTPLTYTVGPDAGANFVDLVEAFSWAGRRRIDYDGQLIFALQSQTTGSPKVHTYNKSVNMNHPDGVRITIKGAGMNFIPSPGNFGGGYYSNVGPGSASGVVSEATAWTNVLRQAFQVELHFNATYGASIFGAIVNIQNVLFTGSGVGQSGQSLITIGESGGIFTNCLGSCLTDVPVSIDQNSEMSGSNFYAFGMGHYVAIAHGSRMSFGGTNSSWMVGDSYVDGVQMTFNSTLHLDCRETYPRLFSCLNVGLNHWGDSPVHAISLNCINCWGFACIVCNQCISYVPNGQCTNAYRGYAVSFGSMDCSNTYTYAIVYTDYYAAFNSEMYAAGFQNGSAQFVPTRNTTGNANSEIVA